MLSFCGLSCFFGGRAGAITSLNKGRDPLCGKRKGLVYMWGRQTGLRIYMSRTEFSMIFASRMLALLYKDYQVKTFNTPPAEFPSIKPEQYEYL